MGRSVAIRLVLVLIAYLIGGAGYLAVNQFIGPGPYHHLALPIDGAIPFIPAFAWGYALVYVTPAFTAFFLTTREELLRALGAFAIASVVCYAIFLIFPVEYPRTFALPPGITGGLLAWIHSVDRPINCFPSHHVATAVTTCLVIGHKNRAWGIVFGLVALLISVSTLFVKQHWLVDIPAGALVAWAACRITLRSRPGN